MSTDNAYAPPKSNVGDVVDDEAVGEINIFSTRGRLGRVRFIGYSMGVPLVAMLAIGLFSALGAAISESAGVIISSGAMVICLIAMFAIAIFLMIQRLHDFNASGWWALLIIVPIVSMIFSLVLWIYPGTKGANRFGAKPPPNGVLAVILAILLFVAIIGVLAAIAIPAYQGYMQEAQQHQMEVQ